MHDVTFSPIPSDHLSETYKYNYVMIYHQQHTHARARFPFNFFGIHSGPTTRPNLLYDLILSMHSISTITVISIARVAFSGMGQARIENNLFLSTIMHIIKSVLKRLPNIKKSLVAQNK